MHPSMFNRDNVSQISSSRVDGLPYSIRLNRNMEVHELYIHGVKL